MNQNIFLSLLLLALTPAGFAESNDFADTILISNKVLTMTSRQPVPATPQAIAIKDEKILWIGAHGDVDNWRGPNTSVVALGDQAVLPGFIDAHGHVSFSALATTVANVASPPVGPVNTIADLQATLKAYMDAHDLEEGEWVVGMGYDDSLIKENRHPTRDDLDAVSTDHPIVLIHVSGHLAATNTRGLARAGINAETPNPPGGVIRRRTNSQEPDGVLEETATYPVRKYMTSANKDPIASLRAALADYASYGITTAQDGAASPEVMDLLTTASAAKQLSIDVIAYPIGMGDPISIADTYTFGDYQDHLKVKPPI